MGSFPRNLNNLCTPAFIYFVISMISLIFIFFQNLGNVNLYSVGHFSCRVPNTAVIFILKLIYVLFWTYVLNLICKDGHKGLSWLLLLLPFLFLFVIIGLVMMNT